MTKRQANFAANRVSNPFLQAPAPNLVELESMLQAANRAPDHANLVPYRFIIVNSDQLDQLGKLFLQASQLSGDVNEAMAAKLLKMPQRAPMIIISIACIHEHPKVPKSEQLITAGLAVHQLCLSAKELGFDSMWRTGALAYNQNLHTLLNLAQNEEITGFIYMGTAYKTKQIQAITNVKPLYSIFGENND